MLSAESCRKVEEDKYGTEEGNEQGKDDEERGEERGGRKRDEKKNKEMAERGRDSYCKKYITTKVLCI